MQDLPEELWHESFRYYVKEDSTRRGGPNLRMIRLDPSKPSLTVTGYAFNKFVHPHADRFITVREAARLQGFPDDLEFMGSLTSMQQQVGNAVPVEMSSAIFSHLLANASKNGQSKKLNALSLFSGAGGLDIGAQRSKHDGHCIEVPLAIDNWKDACDTLSNYAGPRTTVRQQDISKIDDPSEYWRDATRLSRGPDVVFGGPPCQAFSQAGKQKALCDPRGELIFEFVRFVSDLSPSYFVMENVPNLASVDNGGLLKQIMRSMQDCGYNVSTGVLCAADYGTAQLRKRRVFVGCRGHLGSVGMPPITRCPSSNLYGLPGYRTVGDAFRGLPLVAEGGKREERSIRAAEAKPEEPALATAPDSA
jgi:DNA (cytosine-5)-methyltransferase 1